MYELMQRILIGVRVVLETPARYNCNWFKRHFRGFLKRNPECFCRSTSMLFVCLLRFGFWNPGFNLEEVPLPPFKSLRMSL